MSVFSMKFIFSWVGTILLLHSTFVNADDAFDKLFNDRKYADALKYADEKIPIGSRDASIWAKLGVANEGTELVEKALACYMVAIRNDANSYEAYLGAARIYNKMNQPEQAVEMAQKATAIKATGEVSWEYARALIALKRNKEAKVPLEKLVETDKKNTVANKELGFIYYEEKDYVKALPLLLLTQAAQPSGDIAAKIGLIYQNKQNADSAIYFFREASKDKQFKNPDITLQLARMLFKKEQFKNAAEEFAKVSQGMKGDDLYNYAFSLDKGGDDPQKVIAAYESADKVIGNSGSKSALLGKEKIGRYKIEKKQFKDALDIFMAIVKADPSGKIVADATFLAAEAYEGNGEIAKAIPLLEQVVAKDGENVEAHARLADFYQKNGDKDKAQKIFERLLTIQPDNPKVYMSLGEYSIKTKKWEDALKYYQKGFNLEKNATAAEGMMVASMELKRFDLARDAAETALHYDSSLSKPQIALAQINMQENNYPAAAKIIEAILKQDPKNIKMYQQLALCYDKTKDVGKLAEVDKAIISIDRKDAVSRDRYAKYLRDKGSNDEAFEVLKDLSSLKPKDADVIYSLYEVAMKLGKKDETAVYLQKFVSLKPNDAKAQVALGDFYFDKKDSVAALSSYRNAIAADPAVKGFYKKYAALVMAQKPPEKPLPKGQKTPEEEVLEVLNAAVGAGEADEEIFTTLAEIYQKKGTYSKAIEFYQKGLQKKPQSFELLSSLALCQEKGGKEADAILSYEQAVAMNAGAEKEYKSLGALYLKQGKKEQGINAYKKYIEKVKDDGIALTIGKYQYDLKDYTQAVKYLGMVSGNAAKKSDFLLMFAESAYKTGDVQKAEDLYKQLVVVSPKSPEPFKTLFEIARNKKDMQTAAGYLTSYTALKPDDVAMLQLLGDIDYDLKNNAGALDAYKGVLKVKPDAKGFYKKYVELVTSQGTPEEKVKALSGAIAAGEADVAMYSEMGLSYLKAKDYTKAIQALEKATQLDPKNDKLLISLAQAQAASGAVEMAVITYEQAVAMNPAADKEYKALGDLYMKQKKTESAVKAYKKYLEKSTDDSIAMVIGKFLLDSKNYSDAIKYLGLVKGKDAESAPFLLIYGNACYEAKEDQIAIKIFKKLADLQPQNADIFKTMYELSKRTGADGDALISLTKYTALKPSDAAYQKILGDKLFDQKENTGAAAAYRAALKADPKIKGFYKKLVGLILSTAKDEELVIILNGAIDAGEADITMYTRLGEIYRKQGNSPKAVTMFEKASQLDPKNVELLSGLAEAQAKSGNASGAILTYEQYLAMNSSADSEYKALGDLYLQQKKTESAVKNYKKYLEKNTDSKIAKVVGDFSLDTKAYADAVKFYGMVSGADGESAEFLKKFGEAAFQSKDEERAYSIYKRLSLKTPQDADIFKLLYQIASKNGTKDESLDFLRKFTQLKPNDENAQRSLGDMLYEKHDSRGALNAYRAVLKVNPTAKGFYKKYAELVMAQEPPKKYAKGEKTIEEEIIEVLTAAVAAGEADVAMYRKLGVFYEKSNQYAKAVQTYEKASQLDPKDLSLLKDLARAQVKSNNIGGAILTYEQAVAMNPASVDEYKELGDLYKKQKKIDVAVKNYKKYLEKKKDNQLAIEVGSFAFDQKNFTDAVKYLGMVDGAATADVSYVKLYADASYSAKDDLKSYQLYKKLSNMTPQDANVFKRLYEVAGRAGTKEEVMAYLTKYTALKPTDIDAQETLGNMLYEKKDAAGALAAYSAVLKADPKAKGFYKNYVELLMSSNVQGAVLETALNGAIAAGEADVTMYRMLGGIYAKNNNFIKAVQMYERASQLDPKSVDLLTALADCQAKSGNASGAILTFEQAIAMNPAASKEYKMLGDLYSKQNKEDAAVNNYKKYLEKNADNKLAAQIGAFELKSKDYKEAVKYLGMVSGPSADSAAHLKSYGEASRMSGDDMKAYQIYKKLSLVTPGDADVFQTLYQLAGKVGTKDEVLTFLKAYTKLRTNDADAQKTLAVMLYEKGENVGALAAYRAAIKASPTIKGIYKQYVELVVKEGKDAEIISAINGAITVGEASVDMYSRCGTIFKKMGNPAKAVQMYEKASMLDPKNVAFLTSLAECQVANKDTSAAVLTYEQATTMNPEAEKELKALGDLYAGQKKRDSAVRVYKKYLEKAQDNEVAQIVGEHYFDQKNYPEAIRYFAMVTGSGASDPKFLKKYASSSLLARDEFKAYQIFKQLSNITPKDPDVFEKLSDLATRVGTKDEVTNYLKTYTSIKPTDAKAQKNLGDLLYEKKDDAGALNAYRMALKADSTLKGFYSKYASLVMNTGTEDEKLKAVEGAAAAGEADAKMYAMLGNIYNGKGNLVKAIASFEKAAQLDPKNPGLLSALASCQVKKGAITEAIMTYEQVVAMDPRAEKEFKALGDLYMSQKKSAPAIQAYKRYLEKKPTDEDVSAIVGEEAYKTKNFVDAVKYLSKVTGKAAQTVPFLQMYGDAALKSSDLPRAMIIYKSLSTLVPKDPDVVRKLYEVSKGSGAKEDALIYLKKYTLFVPKDADAQKDLGDALYERKDNEGALKAYSAALVANPAIKGFYKKYVALIMDSKTSAPAEKSAALLGAIKSGEADASIYIESGKMFINTKNYPKAIEMFENAAKLDPKNGSILGLLADAQMKNGSYTEAAITFEQALAMNPNAVKEYKMLGDLYMRQKKTDAAMIAYRKYIDKAPNDEEIAKMVGEYFYNSRKFQDAFRYFGMVKNDKSTAFLVEYGMCAIEVNQLNQAIDILEELRNSKGAAVASNGAAFKALADAYEKNGDKKKAAEVLNDYVKIPGVKDPDASYKRAAVYETINSNLAVQMYEQNAVAYPRDYRNMLKLGVFYSRQASSAQKAIKYLEKCAAITDTIARVWLELGSLYGKSNRDQDMLNAYRKFIEIDPENAEATGKIGEVLLSRNMTDDAMVFLEMANSLKADDPKIMTLLARGYIMTNRRREGAAILEKVVRTTKGNVDDELRMVLADFYIETSEYAKAVEELKAIIAKKKDTAVMIKYSKVLIEMQKFADASMVLQEIKSKEPENLDALMMLGKIKVAQKKYDDAIETYKEILYIDQNHAPALCERANVYMIQGKTQWAQTFYDRAMKADPKYAPTYLGLARIAKKDKDYAVYQDYLEKARKLDPRDKEIQDELKSVKR